jgi:hypothetical protein
MTRTRRRPYPSPGSTTVERPEPRYGRRGNARGKDTSKHTGGHGDLPNRPRKDR